MRLRSGRAGLVAGLALLCLRTAAEDDAIAESRRLKADGEYDRAIAVLETAIGKDPRLDLRVALQNVEMEAERPGLVERYAKLQDGSADARYLLARLRPSAEEFTEVLKMQPKHVAARRALAVYAAWKGPWEEALRGFRALIEENPRDAESRHRFAMALYNRGEWESALEQWGLAAEADPGWPEAWYGLGMAWSTRANWSSAAAAFQRALALDPSHRRAREGLVIALAGQGKWAETAAHRQFFRDRRGKIPAIGESITIAFVVRPDHAIAVREALAPDAAWIFRFDFYRPDTAAQEADVEKPIRTMELRRFEGRVALGETGPEGRFTETRSWTEVPAPETLLQEVR